MADNTSMGEKLIEGAKIGDVNQVETLLKNGVDPNFKDKYGSTALIEASTFGRTEVVKLLLGKGVDKEHLGNSVTQSADPNLQDEDRNTALIRASEYGHLDIVKLLLEEGVDKEHLGNSVTLSVDKEHLGNSVTLSANLNIQNVWGDTALMKASNDGRLEVVKFLLKKGADPNIEDGDGYTALYWASGNEHPEVVKILLEHGVDFNQIPENIRDQYEHLRPSPQTWQEICKDLSSKYNLKELREIAVQKNIKNIIHQDQVISVSKAPKRLICLALASDSQS